MHPKLTKHGKFCKQNNLLPTKTHVELEDNSIGQSKWMAISLQPVESWENQ